jgi:hypothetical protein
MPNPGQVETLRVAGTERGPWLEAEAFIEGDDMTDALQGSTGQATRSASVAANGHPADGLQLHELVTNLKVRDIAGCSSPPQQPSRRRSSPGQR